MAKSLELGHVGAVTMTDKAISIVREDGTNVMLDSDFSIFVTKPDGDNMSAWMTFDQFIAKMTDDSYLVDDSKKAFLGWMDAFYVLQAQMIEPVYSLNELLWAKTYEHEGAVTEQDKQAVIGGWHVFSDGKEFAVIWSSDGMCKEIVPLIDKEVVYIDDETAVLRLNKA